MYWGGASRMRINLICRESTGHAGHDHGQDFGFCFKVHWKLTEGFLK